MLKHIIPIGAVSVGKGLTFKRLDDAYGPTVGKVEMGHLIRTRLGSDPFFHGAYSALVRAGHLVPDHVVLPMAMESYRQASSSCKRIYLDGFPRNAAQADHWIKEGILTRENTLLVVLNASKETCRKRFDHRNELKPDGERSDGKSFERRYGIYEHDHSPMMNRFGMAGILPIVIDANRDLEQFVIPAIIAAAKAFWGSPCGTTNRYESPVAHLSARERFNRIGIIPPPQLTPPVRAQA